jgi:hypothetical protein
MRSKSIWVAVVVLALVVLVLASSPALFFSPTVTFIDTELYRSSGKEIPVRTIADFANPDVVASIPQQIGKWQGSDYDTSQFTELLGADAIVIREYTPSTFTQPLFFTVVQARTDSSFHPSKVCLGGQGFVVQEEGKDTISIDDVTWVEDSKSASIPVARLVVTKNSSKGEPLERRVILFFYAKGNQFYKDYVTMLQVEALAPLRGSYEGTLSEEKAFVSQAVPLMFGPSHSTRETLLSMLVKRGPVGYLILGILCLSPVAIAAYPRLKGKSRKKDD